jgi:hypothetical protein
VPGPLRLAAPEVGATGRRRGPGLFQQLDGEPILPKQSDPLSIGEHEIHLARIIDPVQAEVIVEEARTHPVRPRVLGEDPERARGRKRQAAAGSQYPGSLGYGPVRVAERHRSPVAEHDVKGSVPEGKPLCVRPYQRNAAMGSMDQAGGMAQVRRRKVEPHRTATLLGERDRPTRGPAANLQHVKTPDFPKNVQFRFGDPPQSPGEGLGTPEHALKASFIPLGLSFPESEVAPDMVAALRTGRAPSGRLRGATWCHGILGSALSS